MTEQQSTFEELANRKADHIDLALQSQIERARIDQRFYYEPALSAHPGDDMDLSCDFLGKVLRYPLWVSSMTGGTDLARTINHNLARMCREFGLGMGLGSCRALLTERTRLDDFNVRPVIGDDLPLYSNLGIAQVEELVKGRSLDAVNELNVLLQADGLIIHVNPMQEWLQPEGDHIGVPPVETIARAVEELACPVIVKEVGQGMGPSSLQALLRLPITAIELAAHGGTNFAMLELLRSNTDERTMYAPLAQVGHDAIQMISYINGAVADLGTALACEQVIISGGVRGFLDGYYLMNKLNLPAVYGHASEFLKYARDDYETLRKFAQNQINGLKLAHAYLKVR